MNEDGLKSEGTASQERPTSPKPDVGKRRLLGRIHRGTSADSTGVHEQRSLAKIRDALAGLGGKQKESASKQKDPMDDLRRVGPDKAVGYLPTETIRTVCHEDPDRLLADARDRGLYATIVHPGTPQESLYIADSDALHAVLERHSGLFGEGSFISREIPTTEQFISVFSDFTAPPKTELFDTIADAFADYKNPGRTDIHDKTTDRYLRRKERREDREYDREQRAFAREVRKMGKK